MIADAVFFYALSSAEDEMNLYLVMNNMEESKCQLARE